MSHLYGAVEAGGTKFVCAVGTDAENLLETATFPTRHPVETLQQSIQFFKTSAEKHGALKAIGVGSFGPLDLAPSSPTYGQITSTPKPGWSGADMVKPFQDSFEIPVALDTDVNAAALGEWRWGAGQGLEAVLYLTVGTGIGGGVVIGGQPLHGLLHPEMGHVLIPHDRHHDPFEGSCPYHGDCLEGLAAGPALQARWGKPAQELPAEHPAWALEAHYLAEALVNFILTLSPQRIILGGGVMSQAVLFPLIRARVQQRLNGYVQAASILQDIQAYIVPPALGSKAGILGALALAQNVVSSF